LLEVALGGVVDDASRFLHFVCQRQRLQNHACFVGWPPARVRVRSVSGISEVMCLAAGKVRRDFDVETRACIHRLRRIVVPDGGTKSLHGYTRRQPEA
jgi:hypothetical protein